MSKRFFNDEESTMTRARMVQLVGAGLVCWFALVGVGMWIIR